MQSPQEGKAGGHGGLNGALAVESKEQLSDIQHLGRKSVICHLLWRWAKGVSGVGTLV